MSIEAKGISGGKVVVKTSSNTTTASDPVEAAYGAFADDANWGSFLAAIEKGRQEQNRLESRDQAGSDWEAFQDTLNALRRKRIGKQSEGE